MADRRLDSFLRKLYGFTFCEDPDFAMLLGQPLLMSFGLVSDRWGPGAGYTFFG
jgi:hypothetical protein